MTKELEPCPFCGCYAVILHPSNEDHFGYFHSVACCTTEGCRGEQFDTWYGSDEEAIEAWNTRYKRTCKSDYCRETDEWQCLSCGGTLQSCAMFDPDVDGFVGSPKFCPNCGAEVVDD